MQHASHISSQILRRLLVMLWVIYTSHLQVFSAYYQREEVKLTKIYALNVSDMATSLLSFFSPQNAGPHLRLSLDKAITKSLNNIWFLEFQKILEERLQAMSKLFKHGLVVIILKFNILGSRPGVLGGLTIVCTANELTWAIIRGTCLKYGCDYAGDGESTVKLG